MAYTNDYSLINNCQTIGDWTAVGTFAVAAELDTTNHIEGTGCIGMRCDETSFTSPQTCGWRYTLTAGQRFSIMDEDLLCWFYYVKGKGQQFLTDNNGAVTIRVYFGTGQAKWADYRPTVDGEVAKDSTLRFGWQTLIMSGKNMNGGSVGGTHNNGTDWDLDVYDVEIRLEFNDYNTTDQQDPRPALLMDYWRSGTKIVVSEGTVAVPVDFSGLQSYSDTNTLGVVNIVGRFVSLRCGLDIGNGSDGANNEGNLVDAGKFILFDQESLEVKHNLVVENYSKFQLGTLEVGTDGSYPVDGCQFVLTAGRYSDIDVKPGGIFNLYDTKLYQWRYIYCGNGNTGQQAIDLRTVDVDSCETIYLRQTNITLDIVEVHDNSAQINNHCGEVTQTPTSSKQVNVHDCNEGFHFRASVSFEEYIAGDNTNYDLAVLEGATVDLLNSVFSPTKLKRLAA